MPKLTPDEIAKIAHEECGLEGEALATAVAIAMAESGGNSEATNDNANGSTDYGLWQINDKAHPEYDKDRLKDDPRYNARCMCEVSKHGANWKPWSVFKNGGYEKFLQAGRDAAKKIGDAPVSGTAAELEVIASKIARVNELMDLREKLKKIMGEKDPAVADVDEAIHQLAKKIKEEAAQIDRPAAKTPAKPEGGGKGGGTPPKKTKYKIKEGDTLSKLANEWHTKVQAILDANPGMSESDTLHIGDEINKP